MFLMLFYSICQITTDRFVFNSIETENENSKSPEQNKKKWTDAAIMHSSQTPNTTENDIQMISNLEYRNK